MEGFVIGRLIPSHRVSRKLRDVADAERAAQWEDDYKRVETERDKAAAALHEYPAFAAKLVSIIQNAAEVDKAVSRINGPVPHGEHRRLETVKPTARAGCDLRGTIAAELRVPNFENPKELLWLPPQPSLAAGYA